MIAPRVLPDEYEAWNRRWHAPWGRSLPFKGRLARHRLALMYRGPFAHQMNSETRVFEYPWAHDAITRLGDRPLRIVDIGGGLGGLQFVLASEGHHVINVDPGGQPGAEWGFSPEQHAYLCRLYRAPVTLRPTTLSEAGLPSGSVDAVVSISVLEHLPPEQLSTTASEIQRILRPGGAAILTVDLFLDLQPFTDVQSGRWGTNVNVREVLSRAGLDLVAGHRPELNGFPEFSPQNILARKNEFLVSNALSTAQCMIATK